jgi:hypothetical protein
MVTYRKQFICNCFVSCLGSDGKYPSIKKLEHALEDQIYHILRKSRVITNIRYDISGEMCGTIDLN